MKASVTSIALAGLLLAGSATADSNPFDEIASQSAIERCVAQVGEQVDYGHADRVVHTVESKRFAIYRYKLNIESVAYDGDEEVGNFTASCVVGVTGNTIKFNVKKSG